MGVNLHKHHYNYNKHHVPFSVTFLKCSLELTGGIFSPVGITEVFREKKKVMLWIFEAKSLVKSRSNRL
jgi:hypothetical protein